MNNLLVNEKNSIFVFINFKSPHAMRKINYLFILFLLISLISCDEQGSVDDLNSDQLNSKASTTISKQFIALPNDIAINYCGSSTYTFWAGQNIDAGTVVVGNDAQYLYVTATSTAGFQNVSENLKMWVGTNLGDMPQNNQGVPTNGQFPYKATVSGNSFTFKILLSDIFGKGDYCPLDLFVVVHGDVKVSVNGQTSAQTAYGGDKKGTSNRWWYYINQKTVCCPENEYAFLYKGDEYVTCFNEDGVNGWSNGHHYLYYRNGGVRNNMPIYFNSDNDCDADHVSKLGDVDFSLLNAKTDNEEFNMHFSMNSDQYKYEIYIGWKNPVENGMLVDGINFVSVDPDATDFDVKKATNTWDGVDPRIANPTLSSNPPFYVIVKVILP